MHAAAPVPPHARLRDELRSEVYNFSLRWRVPGPVVEQLLARMPPRIVVDREAHPLANGLFEQLARTYALRTNPCWRRLYRPTMFVHLFRRAGPDDVPVRKVVHVVLEAAQLFCLRCLWAVGDICDPRSRRRRFVSSPTPGMLPGELVYVFRGAPPAMLPQAAAHLDRVLRKVVEINTTNGQAARTSALGFSEVVRLAEHMNVLAYVGNTNDPAAPAHAEWMRAAFPELVESAQMVFKTHQGATSGTCAIDLEPAALSIVLFVKCAIADRANARELYYLVRECLQTASAAPAAAATPALRSTAAAIAADIVITAGISADAREDTATMLLFLSAVRAAVRRAARCEVPVYAPHELRPVPRASVAGLVVSAYRARANEFFGHRNPDAVAFAADAATSVLPLSGSDAISLVEHGEGFLSEIALRTLVARAVEHGVLADPADAAIFPTPAGHILGLRRGVPPGFFTYLPFATMLRRREPRIVDRRAAAEIPGAVQRIVDVVPIGAAAVLAALVPGPARPQHVHLLSMLLGARIPEHVGPRLARDTEEISTARLVLLVWYLSRVGSTAGAILERWYDARDPAVHSAVGNILRADGVFVLPAPLWRAIQQYLDSQISAADELSDAPAESAAIASARAVVENAARRAARFYSRPAEQTQRWSLATAAGTDPRPARYEIDLMLAKEDGLLPDDDDSGPDASDESGSESGSHVLSQAGSDAGSSASERLAARFLVDRRSSAAGGSEVGGSVRGDPDLDYDDLESVLSDVSRASSTVSRYSVRSNVEEQATVLRRGEFLQLALGLAIATEDAPGAEWGDVLTSVLQHAIPFEMFRSMASNPRTFRELCLPHRPHAFRRGECKSAIARCAFRSAAGRSYDVFDFARGGEAYTPLQMHADRPLRRFLAGSAHALDALATMANLAVAPADGDAAAVSIPPRWLQHVLTVGAVELPTFIEVSGAAQQLRPIYHAAMLTSAMPSPLVSDATEEWFSADILDALARPVVSVPSHNPLVARDAAVLPTSLSGLLPGHRVRKLMQTAVTTNAQRRAASAASAATDPETSPDSDTQAAETAARRILLDSEQLEPVRKARAVVHEQRDRQRDQVAHFLRVPAEQVRSVDLFGSSVLVEPAVADSI